LLVETIPAEGKSAHAPRLTVQLPLQDLGRDVAGRAALGAEGVAVRDRREAKVHDLHVGVVVVADHQQVLRLQVPTRQSHQHTTRRHEQVE
jgi:hypothetical protein